MRNFFRYTTFLFLLSIPAAVYGCSCLASTPATAFNDSKAVFIGKMIGGTEKNTVTGQGGASYEIESGEVKFEVEESFKGNPGKTVTIQINSHRGTSCGTYGLIRGTTYLVYAYTGQEGSGMMYTGVCTRTSSMLAGGRKEDLDFLRSLPPAGSGGSITGRIWLDTGAISGGGARSVPGVRIKITGPTGNVTTVVTDKKGEFRAASLPAGNYRIAPVVPANYHLDEESDEVTVADLGTATTGFELKYNGRVSGRIVDKNGVSYKQAVLHIENAVSRIYGNSDGKGGFSVEGVPPGIYTLYIDLHHDEYAKNRKYYYPGTFNPARAGKIKVGLGQAVGGLKFTLPAEFRLRKIEGQVFWASGRPVPAGIDVSFLCPASARPGGYTIEGYPVTVETDAMGRFVFEGFTGTVYWLEARATINGEGIHSPPHEIKLTTDLKDIQVILSEKGSTHGCSR